VVISEVRFGFRIQLSTTDRKLQVAHESRSPLAVQFCDSVYSSSVAGAHTHTVIALEVVECNRESAGGRGSASTC